MATSQQWLAGARPRTLPAALSPVLVGTGLASVQDSVVWTRALLALIVAIALQVGVNYANDYSDGIRGTDDVRVGPIRLVGQRLAAPAQVRNAAFAAFGVAAVAGLTLVVLTGAWWLLGVGAAAIAAAWFYTGGPSPYGYAGLGELFVLVFFGFVAVCGTSFVQTGSLGALDYWCALAVGLYAVAILIVNNLRDIPGDTESGKRTLAVRLGDATTRKLYIFCMLLPLLIVSAFPALIGEVNGKPLPTFLALVTFIITIPPIRTVQSGAMGRDLIPVLVATGRVLLVFGITLTVGLVLAG